MEDNNTNNNNTNNNSKNNGKYKNNTCIMIILFLLALGAFTGIYFLHTKNIESRFNKALENYSLNIQTIISNTTIDKTVTTNESENTITINNEFIISEEIANNFKSTFDINTRMLESSMAEIMKNSNDVLSFWFAFLSVIMIVFTFAGIFINNNILSESKENLEYIENLKKEMEEFKYESKKLISDIDIETQKNINKQQDNINKFIQDVNKQYKEAIENYDKAVEFNPNYSDAYNNRGAAKNNLKQYEEAIKDYDKAIELNHNYSGAYNNRGVAKNNLKQYKEAIKDFDKAIELNHNSSKAYYNRGISKGLLENYEEAIKDYNKAIELNPNSLEAYYNRALDKIKLKNYEEAIKDYNKTIELNPNYSDAYFNMVLAKQLLINNTKSKKERKKLIEEGYNDFIKGYNLADDTSKKEYEQRIIDLANIDNEVIIKICDEMGWEY